MAVTLKESIELMLTHSSLVQIRAHAITLINDGVKSETVEQILALADAFHEVPAEIARGGNLNPTLFRALVTEVEMGLPSDYPA